MNISILTEITQVCSLSAWGSEFKILVFSKVIASKHQKWILYSSKFNLQAHIYCIIRGPRALNNGHLSTNPPPNASCDFGIQYLAHHYYTLSVNDLCPRVEILKEKMYFTIFLVWPSPSTRNTAPGGYEIWNLHNFGRPSLGHHYITTCIYVICMKHSLEKKSF